MSRESNGRTFAVLGHYHGRNLGDDLVVTTILNAIRRRVPGADVLGISLAPGDTERRHGIRAFPINPMSASSPGNGGTTMDERRRGAVRTAVRRLPGALRARRAVAAAARCAREVPFSLRAFRLLRGVDTVVVAGSGPLLDGWRGAWAHPYTILRWSILSRLSGTQLVVPSIGAGPIQGFVGRLMIRRIVTAADFISVRDAFSADLLHSVGVSRELPVRPDMGYGYPLAGGEARPGRTETRVGVNVMAHEDPRYWPKGDGGRYRTYLAKMLEFVVWLLGNGYEVVLFSSQTSSDALVAGDVLTALEERGLAGHPGLRSAFPEIAGSEDLVRNLQNCDYIVAARFHSILIPLALGIPTIGLAYHGKTRALFEYADQPGWCLDIDRFQVEELEKAFDAVRAADGDEIRQQLRVRAAVLREAVEAQFDEILGVEEFSTRS